MSRRIIRKPRARRDLLEHFVYIAEHSSVEDAERFLAAAKDTCEQILKMPEIGSSRNYQHPRLTGLRMWPVHDFQKYLIFYRPMDKGIDVIRVLHGARDLRRLFTEEE